MPTRNNSGVPSRAGGSYWSATSDMPRFPRLDGDRTVDVVVIGAGLTGITTAFALKEAGLTVALVERRRVGGVDTAATTAHLTAFADTRPSELVSRFGGDDARLVWEAGEAAIDHIEMRVTSLGIESRFARVPGFYHVPFDAADDARERAVRDVAEGAEALAKIGVPHTRVDAAPVMGSAALRVERQARIHPLGYLASLVALVPGHGSLVCEGDVARVDETPGVVLCGPHVLRAGHVVFATHNPMQGSQSLAAASLLQTNLALYTSYALRARLPEDPGVEGLFWDTNDPYRYVRLDRAPDGGFEAICGGEDHKTGQASSTLDHREALRAWVQTLLPGATIAEEWSGQVIEPADGLPMIGEVAEREYVATGYSGNGTTFGTIAALVVRDRILGHANRFADRFNVGRGRFVRQPVDYVRENIDYPYHLVKDWLKRNPSSEELEALAPGEGRLVEIEGTVMAASRSLDGRLSLCGSVCTHLGCRVGWNAAEHTWDCPCHGSRFDADGHVLAGPAERDL